MIFHYLILYSIIMLMSQIFIPTLKESPAEAVVTSHKLMIRSGMIRKLSSGLYSFLPLGLRVFNKVANIIREEMNAAGAQEFSLPILTPAELWQKSGRWDAFGPELMRIRDRGERWNVLGPTHEEVFTEIVRMELSSYKQLPLNFYQIKTKYRDEIRPRFGVMRCREFTMKDAYSFDVDDKASDLSYDRMKEAYSNIFKRCGLDVVIVEADTGAMGGKRSEEFMVVSDIGEETLVVCEKCSYFANLEKAECAESTHKKEHEKEKPLELKEIDTPAKKTIEELTDFLKVSPEKFIKTILYAVDKKPVIVLIRGDLEINESKLKNVLKAGILELADEELIKKVTKADVGFAGPVNIKKVSIYADNSIKPISNAVTGANKNDKHLINVNPDRDFKVDEFVDIRTSKEGDLCVKCGSSLLLKRGIEVGHIFKLGRRYTESMGVKFLDRDHKEKIPIMGCYGIGVDRTIAAVIEQSNDKHGIIWPVAIAPFQIIIINIIKEKNEFKDFAGELYKELDKKYEILMDERDVSPGFKFKDADLIGIPIKLILSDKGLGQGKVEVEFRSTGKKILIEKSKILPEIEKFFKQGGKYEI